LDAFDHDTTFNSDVNDVGFHFSYNTNVLDARTKEVLRPLMESFYNDLLKAGFPDSIHGGTGKLDRDALVASFWDANPEMRVCPACDDKRPDSVDDKVNADEDHFFPKSLYPFLSVHAANLLPVCTDCNRRFKLGADPIDDHYNEPLANSFHPYDAPALDHVDVQTTRSAAGERQISIVDRRGMPSRRVNSLNNILKLEKRWRERLDESVEIILDELRGQSRLLKRLRQTIDDADFRETLEDTLSVRRDKIGKTHWYVLHTSYLQFALGDADELDLLLTEFADA
jgi:hypothetical protein